MGKLIRSIQESEIDKGYYNLNIKPYRRVLISSEGLNIIKTDKKQTLDILEGLYKRLKDVQESKFYDHTFEKKHLSPHIKNKHKYLGNGSEGQVFQFKYPEKNIAIKFYKDIPRSGDSVGGIGQFLALKDAHERTGFKTPKPYFATRFMCALEDFSEYPDYFEFIKDHPKEKKKLRQYIEKLSLNNEFCIDIGDIYYSDLPELDPELFSAEYAEDISDGFEDIDETEDAYDITLEDMCNHSSVYIIEFHPSKKKLSERYMLGTVDISLR